jgi:hypothetical protein
LRQCNHLVDRRIKIKVILLRRRLLNLIADAVDDASGAIGLVDERASASLISLRSGGCLSKKFSAARAYMCALAIGCVIS